MAKTGIGQVTTTQTFQNWLDKTNDIVDLLESDVMTASVLGDTTEGNATLVGSFTANTIIGFDNVKTDVLASKTLSGTIGATSPISVSSSGTDSIVINDDTGVASGPRISYTSGGVTWNAGFNSIGNGPNDNYFAINTGIGTPKLTLSPTGDLEVAGNITSTGTATFATVDINGGNIDGTVIGAASAASGTFTTLTVLDELDVSDASTITFPVGFGFVPTGAILMWSGSIASIPPGWALCDGTNGTPNLQNRFIVGAGDGYAVDARGGANRVTLTTAQMPAHTHGAGTLETNSAGSHTHTYDDSTVVSSSISTRYIDADDGGSDRGNLLQLRTTDPAGAHTHTINGNTDSAGSDAAHENRPPYYALAYIMKL